MVAVVKSLCLANAIPRFPWQRSTQGLWFRAVATFAVSSTGCHQQHCEHDCCSTNKMAMWIVLAGDQIPSQSAGIARFSRTARRSPDADAISDQSMRLTRVTSGAG